MGIPLYTPHIPPLTKETLEDCAKTLSKQASTYLASPAASSSGDSTTDLTIFRSLAGHGKPEYTTDFLSSILTAQSMSEERQMLSNALIQVGDLLPALNSQPSGPNQGSLYRAQYLMRHSRDLNPASSTRTDEVTTSMKPEEKSMFKEHKWMEVLVSLVNRGAGEELTAMKKLSAECCKKYESGDFKIRSDWSKKIVDGVTEGLEKAQARGLDEVHKAVLVAQCVHGPVWQVGVSVPAAGTTDT